MTRFAFVMVLMSLIVGLGITELLTNIARQIKERATIRHYWLHSGIVVFVFLILLQQWWEAWDLQSVEHWTLLQVLSMLSVPMAVYITANLLFPRILANTDFKEYYSRQCRVTWSVAALATLFAAAFRPLSFGDPLIDIENVSTLILFLAFAAMAWVQKLRFHEIMLPIILAAAILDLFVFSFRI